MHYVTVFDAAAQRLRHWESVAIGLVGVAFGAVYAFFRRRQRIGRWAILGFAVVWTCVTAIAIFGDDLAASRDLRAGNCTVVEGIVNNYRTGTQQKDERFSVNGVNFEYSDYVDIAELNHKASQGGPIRPGLPVRICHRQGEILLLQIAQP
jgi:hypothetical protein